MAPRIGGISLDDDDAGDGWDGINAGFCCCCCCSLCCCVINASALLRLLALTWAGSYSGTPPGTGGPGGTAPTILINTFKFVYVERDTFCRNFDSHTIISLGTL